MHDEDIRPGELRLPAAALAGEGAHVVFIGRIRTAWTNQAACPKNLRLARASGEPASVEVAPAYRAGLKDLDRYSHIVLLYWMHRARRDLVIQHPRSAEGPRGVFSLRSPLRPNPIGLGVVRLLACDARAGIVHIDAMDCLDGTPLLDIKPYLPSVDCPPGEVTGTAGT